MEYKGLNIPRSQSLRVQNLEFLTVFIYRLSFELLVADPLKSICEHFDYFIFTSSLIFLVTLGCREFHQIGE